MLTPGSESCLLPRTRSVTEPDRSLQGQATSPAQLLAQPPTGCVSL